MIAPGFPCVDSLTSLSGSPERNAAQARGGSASAPGPLPKTALVHRGLFRFSTMRSLDDRPCLQKPIDFKTIIVTS